MDAIEKRARELLAAQFAGKGSDGQFEAVTISHDGRMFVPADEAIFAIIAALMVGGSVDLLDQDSASLVPAKELDVVLPSALRADEAGSVGIGQIVGGLPRDVELAEVAPEHEAGVRPQGDGEATAGQVEDQRKLVEQAQMLLAEAFCCDPSELSGDEIRAARAILAWQPALTPPEGYVLVEQSKLGAVRVARLAVLQKEAEAEQMNEPSDASMWADCAADLDAIAPRRNIATEQAALKPLLHMGSGAKCPRELAARVAAPAGWVLVPVEPTPAMSAAGLCVSEAEHDPAGVYLAMLAARPEVP